MTQRENGYVAICMVDGATEYRLPLDEYERVLAEWKSGAAFIDLTQYFGATGHIKGARIESVWRWLPDQLAAYEENRRAEKSEDAIQGGD